MEENITSPQPDAGASATPEAQAPETNEVQEQNTGAVAVKEQPVVTGGTEPSNLEAKRRASEMYLKRENRRLKEQLEKFNSQHQSTPQAQPTKNVSLFEDPDKFMAQHDEELANRILAGLEQRETAKASAQREEEAKKILEQLGSEGKLESVQEILSEHPELDNLDSLSAMKLVQKMVGGTRNAHPLTPRKSLSGTIGSGTSSSGTVRPSVSELKAKVASMQSEFGAKHNDPEFMKQWNKAKSDLEKLNKSENF